MADLSDVNDALVALIGATLYPNGNEAPSALGLDTRVYAGWPDASELEKDMLSTPSVAHVSVYPRAEEHNTTRYPLKWEELSRNVATLSLTVSGQTVTVAGSVPPASAANPQNVMVLANGKPYVYSVQPTDTAASIAGALSALISADIGGTFQAGASIVLPLSAVILAARVGVTGKVRREVRRQEKLFQIGVWASTPKDRDALAKAIDPVLAGTFWLNLADGSRGRLIYRSSIQSDAQQRERAYRRELLYTVEFATYQVQTATEITQGQVNFEAEVGGVPPPEPLVTRYS